MNDASERVWKWIFEFKADPKHDHLDEANSKLFDQKIKWLCENETDDNILRSYAVLRHNLPQPSVWGEGKAKFESKFGNQIIDGPRGGPWMSGFDRPEWAKKQKTPAEQRNPKT